MGSGHAHPGDADREAFTHSGVDHAEHDTTSILKLIEDKFHLPPLTARDKAVRSLKEAVEAAN